jgi:hypothetical protein
MWNIFKNDHEPEADQKHKDSPGEKGLQSHLLPLSDTPQDKF